MEKSEVEERQQTLAERLKARAANIERRKLEEIAIILIDASGSMADHCKSGKTKMQAVKDSVPYLQARGSYVEYGMVSFDSNAQPIQQPTTNFSAILIQLDVLQPGAATNIPSALNEGLKMFMERQVEKKRMILMSDGENNEEKFNLDQRVTDCVKAGVVVDTIAFGDNADVSLLQSIATRTGGMFQKVDDPLQLEQAYQKLNFQVRYLEHKNGQ